MARKVDKALLEEQRLARDLASLDFATVHAAAAERSPQRHGPPCAICRGAFGPVLDSVDLLRGRCFLTAHAAHPDGLELLQVTSTLHRDDLDTVPPMDAIAVFEAMAKAEGFLLGSGDSRFPETGPNRRGWVTIEKHRRAGRHGVQSLRLRAAEPRAVARERLAIARHGGGTPSRLETRNPAELLLGEFRGGLAAAVPASPRRAFEIVIWFRPSATGVLADLDGNQRWGLAQAVREVTGALQLELSVRGLPRRYAWRFIGGAGIEPYLQIVTPRTVVVDDTAEDRVSRLKNHIGVE